MKRATFLLIALVAACASRQQVPPQALAFAGEVAREVPRLRQCYLQFGDPNLSRYRSKAEWTVQPDGSVTDIRFFDEFRQPVELLECRANLALSWKFKPQAQVLHVSFPFVFDRADGSGKTAGNRRP
jgi:hypothetical protein